MAVPVTNPYVQAFTKNLIDLQKAGAGSTGIAGLMAPNMQTVSDREAQLKKYLGSTDYSKQLEESQNQGKLQLALALAQRGFAAAGATPQRGESSISTLSRELFSPLAGDAGAVAGRMMQQRQALKNAERQEDRQLKLAALQQVTAEYAAFRDLAKASIPKAGTGKLQIVSAGLFQKNLGDGKVGNPVVTKIVPTASGVLGQVRGDTGEKISVGPGIGQYRFYEKPTGTAATPKGLETDEFKASFRGMMAQMGDRQEAQGLGKTSVRFKPNKFALNPELKPGVNFPIERVVGVNQADGSVATTPLTETQQKTYADNLRASYLNLFKSQKPGQEPANLNNTFIARELRKSFNALGLPAPGQLPAGVVRGRDQITNPKEITAEYVAAVPKFATDVQGTLDKLPFGVDNNNLRTGTAKLVLFNELGVNFGPPTVSPAPLSADSNAATVGKRAADVRSLDAGSIQERILAESAANGTSMGSKLNTSTADSRPKQLAVVGEQLKAEKERLVKGMSTPGAAKDLQVLEKSLEMLVRLQKLDFDLKQSGVTGFVRGPTEGVLQKYLGIDVGAHFRTAEGRKATARFLQSLPITQQLFARDILRQAGEQRFTNKDLTGAQDTLVKLNQDEGFNAGALRELTGYLKSIVKSGLSNAGTFDISPATLEKAAMLGIDLKSITPKNNYYSPYFNQGKYAVTKQPVPQYSKQYMDGLRDNGIFGYAAVRGTTGGAPMYRLIDVDSSTGLPIQVDPDNPKKGFKTVTVSGAGDWKAGQPKTTLDFNRNYLLKTYGLDK